MKMEWLNYHHLFYFWTIMREGSITAACRKLNLAQSTVSSQLAQLEENLNGKLFLRQGRVLKPTDLGLTVFRYADRIFALGHELLDQVHGKPMAGPLNLRVGVVDVVTKLMVRKLLEPAITLPGRITLSCHEGKAARLLSELAIHNLDLVIADRPNPDLSGVKAYSHFLGECGVTFFAAPDLSDTLPKAFPACLNGAPVLLPMKGTRLREALGQWFEQNDLRPVIAAEFEDTTLMKVFGQEGDGIFAAPSAIEDEVSRQFQVTVLGRSNSIKERFYAISVERLLKHPAVVAITRSARHSLF